MGLKRIRHFFFCALFAASFAAAQLQVETIFPSQVIDVRAIVRAETHRQDFVVKVLAQSNGRWAALVLFDDLKTSLIVTGGGTETPRLSEPIEGFADRVAIDPSGHIYVCLRGSRTRPPEIETLEASLKVIGRQPLKEALEPIVSGTGVFWTSGSGNTVFQLTPLGLIEAGSRGDARNLRTAIGGLPEAATVLSLSNGDSSPRWITVEPVAEQVSVFENNGVRVSTHKLEIDGAYLAAGLSIPSRNPAEGVTLVALSVVARNGDLYAFLSSRPYGRPVPVAVLDPLTGRLRSPGAAFVA